MGCLLRLFFALVVLVLLLLGAVWLFGPAATYAWLGRNLPQDVGEGAVMRRLSTSPPPEGADVVAEVPPARLRVMFDEWMPPWLIRGGHSLSGTWDEGGTSTRWLLVASNAAERPRLRGRLDPVPVNAWLARRAQGAVDFGGLRMQGGVRIDGAEIEDDVPGSDEPRDRRLLVRVRGALVLVNGTQRMTVPIRHLAARADVRFDPVLDGWRPTVRITIERLDVGEGTPFADLRPMLADLANQRLAVLLGSLVLPAWTPRDLRVDLRLGDGAPPPAEL